MKIFALGANAVFSRSIAQIARAFFCSLMVLGLGSGLAMAQSAPVAIPTTTELFAWQASAVIGQSIKLQANLTMASEGAAGPVGTVSFFEGTTLLGVSPLQPSRFINVGSVIPPLAELTLSNLSLGEHTITAVYSGDTFYAPSTSNMIKVTITPAPFTLGQSYSGPTATSSGNAQISFTGGGVLCGFTRAAFVPLTGDPSSPPAGTAPSGESFDHGLINFVTSGCVPGSTLTFVVAMPTPLPASTQYWKYGPTPSNTSPHWYLIPSTINGNTITFSITDGGLGDDDLQANGTIVDPGGPSTSSVRPSTCPVSAS